ncbi:amidohydrolase family protein [Sphingomonas sp. BN140010]|uniref:Amidohydrolase family protein n=1 Tax=Sphingomonas arvum TaxID=2992113 RepID=A0ABT3JCD5_9SPHN|nr:amidohydrolase family protein [Sphingomonas sp. BN140010]MCW3796696.1 amidohydrolase family protein [Sphingomonas sp. BN140010]
MIRGSILSCLLLASTSLAHAQEQSETRTSPSQAASEHLAPQTPQSPASASPAAPKWNVEYPRGLTLRKVRIDTDEGTWMNVDVSPDGSRVAFDMLGDVYIMPINGGTPTRIAEGLSYEQQPRWSPDGTRIAFVSDRGGGDNIWIMNADGSNKRQLTKEDFRLLNQPSWSPDGRYIVAKKHFTTTRSLGTGEVWLYHVDGGTGVQLVKRVNEKHQKELGEPIFAADGQSVYFTRNITPGGVFQYAQDSNGELFAIERYELDTGETHRVTAGNGGAVRPTPSPDGKYLAFVRRERAKSKLYVRDLASGNERKVYDLPDQDMQETWAVTGVYPNMDWTADSREVVLWAGGKLRRVPVSGGAPRDIPFRVADDRVVAESLHPTVDVAPDSFQTKMVRWAQVSPDGRSVVFESLGKLWVKPAPGGEARRLTRGQQASFEAWPSWSRDGRSIAFVSWTDAGLGRIMATPARGGSARAVTSEPGHYSLPRFSPDGRTIAFEARSGGGVTSDKWGRDSGVYIVATNGGAPQLVRRDASNPQFGSANDRLFATVQADDKLQLVSMDLTGERRRVHASGDLTSDFEVSPDGHSVAFRENYEAFLMPLLPGAQDVTAATDKGALPAVRLSTGGGDFIHFSQGGARVHWSIGPSLYTADTRNQYAGSYKAPASALSLSQTVRASKPAGAVALTGARIITMRGDDGGIIEDGVILIRGDRIAAVGTRAEVPVPAGTPTVDVGGKTIVPGFIDAHAHGPQGENGFVPQQNWSTMANLALGTTTIHDPSNRASEVFAASEMQRAGLILAPRIFSTGEIIYGAKAAGAFADVGKFDDALAHVRRLKAQGAWSVKNYNQPRREQRQMVVAAAQAEGMLVVPEGGSLFNMDMSLIQDGNATIEHNVPGSTFYNDVLQMWSQTKTNYTPTLVVTYGGPAGDPYWRSHTNVYEQPLLKAHIPPGTLAAANARREIAPEEDYSDTWSAREARKLADRGIQVSIGAHGQQDGIGAHWEMWSFVKGGWTPLQALQAATVNPSRTLGLNRDLGSLEVGKLADLVVLDANPLDNIRNTERVAQVMLGGRLYDAATLNERVTGNRQRQPYWWELSNEPLPGRASAEVHSHKQ